MAGRKKSKTQELKLAQDEGATKEQTLAQSMLRPSVHAGITVKQFIDGAFGDKLKPDLGATIEGLVDRATAVSEAGDLVALESMLATQASTLDVMFQTLTRRGIANMQEGYGEAADRYFKLGLKAQAQCRTAIEALIEAKNPKPVFVGQNNIANNQQVNNQAAPCVRGEKPEPAKQSIDHETRERLDQGPVPAAGGADSTLETVAAEHRAKDRGR